jgi:hypothetical protein
MTATRAEVRRQMRDAFAAGLVNSWSVDSTSIWTIDGRACLSTPDVEQWLRANQEIINHRLEQA